MTAYGKHGKPRRRLSTLPTLFGNPFGTPTTGMVRRLYRETDYLGWHEEVHHEYFDAWH